VLLFPCVTFTSSLWSATNTRLSGLPSTEQRSPASRYSLGAPKQHCDRFYEPAFGYFSLHSGVVDTKTVNHQPCVMPNSSYTNSISPHEREALSGAAQADTRPARHMRTGRKPTRRSATLCRQKGHCVKAGADSRWVAFFAVTGLPSRSCRMPRGGDNPS
jgi:hypothetical protein